MFVPPGMPTTPVWVWAKPKPASLHAPQAAREEVVVTSAGARTLDDLPPSIRVLHTGMPQSAKRADMRLLKLPAVLAWPQLRLYEDVVPGEEALTLPYEDVSEEQWQATVVLSWRWSAGKPAEMVPGFSPMSAQQFEVSHAPAGPHSMPRLRPACKAGRAHKHCAYAPPAEAHIELQPHKIPNPLHQTS